MRIVLLAMMSLPVFACGGDGMAPPDWVAGFDPPAAMDGYTRYVTPTVKDIEPGANIEYCQWVADAAAVSQDVLDVQGLQSATGHHAVLYATTETKYRAGESHECTVDDMLAISFVGGVGAEDTAGAADKLPEGLYFRLPAGQALMANTHWLNATDGAVDGQAVIDIKFAPATADHVTADIFANNGDLFTVPAGSAATYDVSCPIKQDLNLAMVANHMHNYGTSAYSEVVHTDGSKDLLVADTSWSLDEQFNPNYKRYSKDAPMVLHAGDTVHTHCEWANTTGKALLFPDEMCTGVGFYFPSNGGIYCDDNSWPTP